MSALHPERLLAGPGGMAPAGSMVRFFSEEAHEAPPSRHEGLWGVGLALGLVLGLVSLRRNAARPYAGLALYAFSAVAAVIAEDPALRAVLVDSAGYWEVTRFVSAFTAPLGLLAFAEAGFGRAGPWLDRLAWALLGGLALGVGLQLTGAATLGEAGPLVHLASVPAVLLAGASALRAARAGAPQARLFLLGLALLAAMGLPDLLWAARLANLPSLTPWGALLLGLAMAAVLERQFRESRERLQQTSRELEQRLDALQRQRREVEALSEELRRQVAERSHDLATALSGARPEVRARAFVAGDTFDGRYRVVRPLGQGGMGAVYEVERVADGARLALKVLAGGAGAQDAARLAREAEIAARLQHPSLVPVVDVGLARSGVLYLVMELVPGGALEGQRGRFGQAGWGLPLLQQVAAGLAALHQQGIVHRDLKPANVLLGEAPGGGVLARIADFGIARVDAALAPIDDAPTQGRPGDRLTAAGSFMGTPAYMAPELARGAEAAQPPADIFAFGVMAYEVLTGAAPFQEVPVFLAMAGGAPPVPAARPLPPDVPPELAGRLAACLAPDPAARPSAAELLATWPLR